MRRNSFASVYHGTEYFEPTCFARSRLESQIPIRLHLGLWRRTRTWFSPQNPVPTTPAPTRFMSPSCLFQSKYRRGLLSPHLKLPEPLTDRILLPDDSFQRLASADLSPQIPTCPTLPKHNWSLKQLSTAYSQL